MPGTGKDSTSDLLHILTDAASLSIRHKACDETLLRHVYRVSPALQCVKPPTSSVIGLCRTSANASLVYVEGWTTGQQRAVCCFALLLVTGCAGIVSRALQGDDYVCTRVVMY